MTWHINPPLSPAEAWRVQTFPHRERLLDEIAGSLRQ
jgi:hypothetical protein